MSAESFNLLDEPWIDVRQRDGSSAQMSLLDVFVQAHDIRSITGEVATQSVAILRLMLAILYRATPTDMPPHEVWRRWWARGHFEVDEIRSYLDAHRDRFDLLSPVAPFYQVADLATSKGELTSLARLIANVPPKEPYFTVRTQESYERLDLAEAARWLVHAQAFDPSGIKTGAVGDARVKGGRGYPIGLAWAGWLGLVVLQGRSLFETLMLNLDLSARTTTDSAVWEREPQGAGVEDRALPEQPLGPVDLLTWQSRRVRIATDGTRATGALLCNGDPLHPRNQQAFERMTAWRRSAAQEKQHGIDKVLMPQAHDPGRAAWRGLGSLLALGPDGEPREGERPGTLQWLGLLVRQEILPESFPVTVQLLGVEYGSNNSVVASTFQDATLTLPAAIAADERLAALAVIAVGDGDLAVRALGDLARNLALASGWSPDSPTARGPASERARAGAYQTLEGDYLDWLRELQPDADPLALRSAWQLRVARAVSGRARRLVEAAGLPASQGRSVKSGSGERYLNSAIAERWFFHSLREHLKGAFPAPDPGATDDD